MIKVLQYYPKLFCIILIGTGALYFIDEAYGNTAVNVINSGLVRSFNGSLSPVLSSTSTTHIKTEDASSSITIKSNTFANDQGAGANVSATATSSDGITSQKEINQFTPGATSISTTVNASTSNSAPPSTQITVETPAVPVPQAAIAVDGNNALPTVDSANNLTITPAIASPPVNLLNMTQRETAPAIVPVMPPVAPATQSSVIDSSNLISTPTLTQINTPEATFNIVNPSAIAPTLATAITPPATTFIPAFSEAAISQNSTININQEATSNNVKVVREQVTSYEIVGMPSRVWPNLGLTQRLRSSN